MENKKQTIFRAKHDSNNPCIFVHKDIIYTLNINALGMLTQIPILANSDNKLSNKEFRLFCTKNNNGGISDYNYKKNLKILCEKKYISLSDDKKTIELLIPSLVFIK